jgi:ATP/maltotriose-dependent transcriptional regulator MalT
MPQATQIKRLCNAAATTTPRAAIRPVVPLGAANRTEAVTRARQLGLIS